MKKVLLLILALCLIVSPVMAAIDLNEPLDPADEAAFDEILEPIMSIYSFIKYVATVIAAFVLVIAGIVFMTSGSDPSKRDKAKNMIMYVIAGLILIWIAPLIVEFLV
ncbi:MAG: pilin [archaeon]